ncbi:MAG: hypothetical protein LH702_36185 [Phormidesmis sp. CAN_BIN44]|nr:hypothetical protein [Phormidesmis sp. CAN_BIN44]
MFTNIRLSQTLSNTVLLENSAAVRLAQPDPIAVTQIQASQKVLVQAIDTVPVLKPALTTRLEQVRWINPGLAAEIALIREPIVGVPRSQITVPICPSPTVTDEVLFEAATTATKFYLPRYRVAERNQQVQISLAPSPQGWGLTIHLEKYPAAAIQEQVRTAQEIDLDHSISVILQHRLTPGVENGGQKELIFQEVTAEPGGVRSVLQVPTMSERDLLYQVLTNPEYAAVLTIRRSAKVAIPLSESAATSGAIVSSGTGTIRGTWTFSFDTGVEGGTGDVWWEQETEVLRRMVPRGNAQIVSLGSRDFDAIAVAELQSLSYGTAAIDGSVIRWRKRLPIDTIPIFRQSDPESLRMNHKVDSSVLKINPNAFRKLGVSNFRPPIDVDRIDIGRILIRRPPIVIDDNDPTEGLSNSLTNGNVFAVRTNSGNFAKVQVLSYGYDLQVQWVTYRPQIEPQFREVTRVLDVQSDRTPFVFPPSLHPYIFSGITGTNTTFKPNLEQVNGHSYYQDPAERHVFYYLPDSFKLVRLPESPHYPFLKVLIQPIENSEEVQVTINYWAYPYVDAARLEAAAKVLRAKVSDPLPAGVTGIVFEPLVASQPRLFLGLPKGDGSLAYQERSEVLVELRTGFRDSRTFSLQDFQAIYDAIFSPTTQLFQGQVRVSFPDGDHTEIIPFIAQMNDLVGENFDYTKEIDTTTGVIRATLKNTIESPIRINRLGVKVAYDNDAKIDGVISLLSAALPMELKPDESLSFTVTPVSVIAGNNPSEIYFDLSGIEILADSKAIWGKILASQSTMTHERAISVKTTKAVFGDRIAAISVDLKLGPTIDFMRDATPEQLTAAANVTTPIRDLILHEADSGTYEYRSLVILNDGNKVEDPANQWRLQNSETLWITNTELPPLP